MSQIAIETCEAALLAEHKYNDDHHILRSQNAIIARLLERRADLRGAYAEIHSKLHHSVGAIEELFRCLTYAAMSWGEGKSAHARRDRDRIAEVNREIFSVASTLASLLEERSNLENSSSFGIDSFYHIGEVIDAAARGNYLYESYVRERLSELQGRFDLKYWPSLPACVTALAENARLGEVFALNAVARAATSSSRSSKADFFKAAYASIEDYSAGGAGLIPRGFYLTDEVMASLGNCLLDLAPDDLVDGAYLKRLRQRQRQQDGHRQARRTSK